MPMIPSPHAGIDVLISAYIYNGIMKNEIEPRIF
jgi:hypothetical protein